MVPLRDLCCARCGSVSCQLCQPRWIDVLSVQHVFFCWQAYTRRGWPTSWVQPADLLGLAERSLQGLVDQAVVERQITHSAALADRIGESVTFAQYPARCVFEAALRALQSAWIAHTHDATPAAQNGGAAGVVGLDDPCWHAAIAIAGSLTPVYSHSRTRTAQSRSRHHGCGGCSFGSGGCAMPFHRHH
jgi:hypothetical protein